MRNKSIRSLIVLLCLLTGIGVRAQKLATFSVNLNIETQGLLIPLQTNLDELTSVADSSLALFEVNGKERREIPFQVSSNGKRVLHWMTKSSKGKLIYELAEKTATVNQPAVTLSDKDGMLGFNAFDKNLLTYVYRTWYPPSGIDTAFKKSGFIHPLNTPHGQALTRINAPDHYHHYGLWDPWTELYFEGDTVDCWNLKDRKGTVRFKNFVSVAEGNIYSEYQAVQEHVVFKKTGGEKVMLNELQTVRVYADPASPDYYLMDYTIHLNCASESPVTLLEYRYGGLGWRATEAWNKDNSMVLTSEGKNRKQADGSLARWCIVQGQLGDDYGGAVMMSYPANYNHPEPLRIWPEDMNGRGDMFANFSPTKNKSWLLQPGKEYLLRYRFLVFNGKYDAAKAEAAWQYFAHPPAVNSNVNH